MRYSQMNCKVLSLVKRHGLYNFILLLANSLTGSKLNICA